MRRILLVLPVALALGGCSVTFQEAMQQLSAAIAASKRVAQQGAVAICESYPALAATFNAVAATGAVNETTIRDVGVAVRVLDTSCPEILAGNPNSMRIVVQTYAILIKAAADARAQKARNAT